MRSLNLDQLRALLEVVEHGSFSAAARRLNLTQPAVSLQIRELERRFGVRLIERLGKQAHATAPGRDLVDAAQRIFRECELAEAAMRRYRDGWIGRVRIGTTNTALMYELPPILRRLSLDHPGIELHVTNMPTRDSVERLIQNKIDLALVTLPVQNRQLRITPLRPEMLVAIFPAGTQGRSRRDHARLRRASAAGDRAHGRRGARAGRAMAFRTSAAAARADASRYHRSTEERCRFEPRHVDRAGDDGRQAVPDIVVRPLQPPLARTLALIEHRNKPNEPALEIVRNALLGLRLDAETSYRPQTRKAQGQTPCPSVPEESAPARRRSDHDYVTAPDLRDTSTDRLTPCFLPPCTPARPSTIPGDVGIWVR